MKKIKTREAFKQAILAELGEPMIKVNVTDAQIDKCINNALKYFFKYSPYGSFESHYIYTVTADDVAKNYIPVPERIDAVIDIIGKGFILSDLNFMSNEYQMTRDVFLGAQGFSNISLVDYVTLMGRLENTEKVLRTPRNFEFIKFQRRLIPFFSIQEGDIIAMKCYENIDPENDEQDPNYIDGSELFNDETILALATAFTQQVWGNVLKKFGNVILPGGVSLNGEKLFDDAKIEIDKITTELLDSNPIMFFMG